MTVAPDRRGAAGPGGDAGRRPDPLGMTPGEKLAAEWEARHDVAARGARGSGRTVAEHLGRARVREALSRPPAAGPAPVVAAPPASPPPPADGASRGGRHRRRWWQALRRR